MFFKYCFVVLALLAAGAGGCVDIPSSGPPQSELDVRAQTRFVHDARGTDTIAIFLAADAETTVTSSVSQTTLTSGPDTVLVTDTIQVIVYPKYYYKRYGVDFGGPLDVVMDGASMGTLNFGDATPFRNTPAGDRKISLMADAPLIDTLITQRTDSNVVAHYDTTGAGSTKATINITYHTYWQRPPASATVEHILADFKDPSLPINSDRKVSIFLFHDVNTLHSSDSGRVRYGVVNYFTADEHYTFLALPPADTIGLRYLNASRNAGSSKVAYNAQFVLHLTNPSRDTTITFAGAADSLEFAKLTSASPSDSYRHLHSATFSFYGMAAGGSTPVDSLPGIVLGGAHRFTVVVTDSAATYHLRAYQDD